MPNDANKGIRKQAGQFKRACKFKEKKLSAFAKSITLTGLAGNLSANKVQLQRALASWSAGSDPVSRAWLGQMCKLLREKAGLAGQNRNVIRKVDVLDALGVGEDDLYPCPDEYIQNKILNYEAWTVAPSVTTRLDELDPLGSAQAMLLPYLCNNIRRLFALKSADKFNRKWTSGNRHLCFAEAWGSGASDKEDQGFHGRRLRCAKSFLRKVLNVGNKELLILIKLQRYEKGFSSTESIFHHTTAVVRISRNLSFTYYPGRINWSEKK